MERAEAEAVYERGREAVVAVLVALSERIVVQDAQGEQTIERLLSASITCRLQKRSLFTYLTDVLTSRTRGDPAPGLT